MNLQAVLNCSVPWGLGGGVGAEYHTRRVLGNKIRNQRQLFISACFAGGTQRCFPFPLAASINILCLLLVLLNPDTDLGVQSDTRFDTWPFSCCGGEGRQDSGES